MPRLKIKELAEARGLNATDLQMKTREINMKVAYNVILKIFNNPESDVSSGTLKALAAALGVSVRDLWEDDPPTTS